MDDAVQHDETMPFRSGFVTLVGRPNAGKSTLINAVIGKKVAITSNTVQTTRHRFRAVLTRPGFQLGEELNTSALKALEDVDVVAMLVDASKPIGTGDEWVAEHVRSAKAKRILVITKIDLATPEEIEKQKLAAEGLADWDGIVEVSAQTGENVEAFVGLAESFLPEGPQWFPADMDTDQSLEVIIAEFIREKILREFREEIPHAIGVATEELEYVRAKDMYRIFAIVYVERDSQKGMIIGKKGAAIKQVGTQAREDLEQLLGCKVFLDLTVKVKKNWRRDLNQIRRFGYGEGI